MDRDEFMELVYETFADEPDNVLANGIIEAADAYVEHEKAQLFSEGTTKDAISRQAALKALRKCQTYLYDARDPELKIELSSAEAAIKELPIIQPQSTTGQLNDGVRSTAQSTDLIDRGQAIEKFTMTAPQMSVIRIYEAVEILESMPTIQLEPQWIPVSERLPDDLVEVNVTWVNRNPESYYGSIKNKPFTTTAVYYKGEWYWLSATCVDYLAEYGRCDWNKVDKAIEIVAWMPLPEPYKPNNK